MNKAGRKKADRYGRFAEHYAAIFLRLKGYHILARREITPFGEIDLIARKSGLVVFIEVKYRRDKAALSESVTPRAQSRIIKASHYYISRTAEVQNLGQRFDLIFTAPFERRLFKGYPAHIRHIKDAWRTY